MAGEQGENKARGRIFMGDRMLFAGVEGAEAQRWTERDQSLYLEKVRLKAEERAREILASAGREAETLRAAAREEGYAEGLLQAERELAEVRASMGEAAQVVLAAVQGRSQGLFQEWREDLIALLRLAVEKGVGMVLREDRAALLESVYVRAVLALEDSRGIVVRCNPEDAAAVEDIIGLSREKSPELSVWKARADARVAPGDILVESESSLAESRLESRRAAVLKALEGLSLPADITPG